MASFPPPPPLSHRASPMASPQPTPAQPANGQPLPPQKSPKTFTELEIKYNRLKRKYFEMEGRMKDARREKDEAQTHMMRMKTERRAMLERISQLEAETSAHGYEDRRSTAFATPRPTEPSAASIAHFRRTLDTDDRDEELAESRFASRHSRSQWRDEARDHHQSHHQPQALEAATGTTSSSRSGRRKSSKSTGKRSDQQELHPNASTLVSSGGTKLRIKPPHAPNDDGSFDGGSEQFGSGEDRGRPPPPTELTFIEASPISPMHPSPIQGRATSPQTSYARAHSPVTQPRSNAAQRSTKPKRLKAHTVTAKTTSVPMIPRDPNTNEPMLPLNVGIMTIHSLGQVCKREHFHTERYIFPVGYEATRRYLSSTDPTRDMTYHCKILEGSSGPIFQIKAPDIEVIEAGTATGAWSGIVKSANAIRNRQHSNSVSGPDYFGLGQNTIKHLIQGLPGADTLRDYVWQHYVEGGPMGGRHAAVMPALPEDDYFPNRTLAESMDLDQEDRESVSFESVERDSRSPAIQQQHHDHDNDNVSMSAPGGGRRTPPDEESSQHLSPSGRISMASILNRYPSPEPRQHHYETTSGRHSPPYTTSNRNHYSDHHRTASVARDASGRPLLPLEIPNAVLFNLGQIFYRAEFRRDHSIVYPVGYHLDRRYMSAISSDSQVDYSCKILDGGPGGPIFEVTARDQPSNPMRASHPDDAWAPFVKDARTIRRLPLIPIDIGEEFFGLTNPTIRLLIQELDHAKEVYHREPPE